MVAMTTIARTDDLVPLTDYVPTADHILAMRVDWAGYESLLAVRGDSRRPRMAYLDGAVELMTTSVHHERIKFLLGRLLERYAYALGTAIYALGETTQRARVNNAGLEPDESYALDPDAEHPDLGIEVVWTRGVVNKLEIYRRLKVREVWVWQGGTLAIHRLEKHGYVRTEASELLAGVDLALLASFLDHPAGTPTFEAFDRAVAAKLGRPA
jgi:Uma2 family endonuclease